MKFNQNHFGWWLFSILLASGIGGGLSSWGVESLKEFLRSDASIEVVDYGWQKLGGNDFLAIVVKNSGDSDGIVTKIRLNGKEYDEFLGTHTIGPEKLRKHQIEKVISGYCPANTYCEFYLETDAKKIDTIEFYDGASYREAM
jgi:hypothetical protein